jgi:phenylacetate-CoA ligase
MNFDKIKGTLVDFNEMERVLDDAPHIGAWQVELRKINNDPLELDELILHVQKLNGADEAQLIRELGERCSARLEIQPNRIMFHDADEIRLLQGVGTLIKEQKVVDHRPQMPVVKPGADSSTARNGDQSRPDTEVGRILERSYEI